MQPVREPLPGALQLEVDTRCNLKCAMCPTTGMLGRPSQRLEPAELRALLERDFGHVQRISFCGNAEALLNADLPELVRIACREEVWVSVATNGLLLSQELGEELVDAGIGEITISFDTADPATFRTVRGVDAHALVVRNILALRDVIRAKGARTSIELRAVVTRDNLAELEGVIRFAADSRLPMVTFVREMPLASDPERRARVVSRAEYESVPWQKLGELAREGGVRIQRSDSRPEAKVGCRWATNTCYVSAEGDVSACQVSARLPEMRFGNLRDLPFEQIFRSEAYAAFRADVVAGRLPDVCKLCTCIFTRDEPERGGAAG